MPGHTAWTFEFGKFPRTILSGNWSRNETLGYTEASY